MYHTVIDSLTEEFSKDSSHGIVLLIGRISWKLLTRKHLSLLLLCFNVVKFYQIWTGKLSFEILRLCEYWTCCISTNCFDCIVLTLCQLEAWRFFFKWHSSNTQTVQQRYASKQSHLMVCSVLDRTHCFSETLIAPNGVV